MADPILHVKDAYYFEVPKFLWRPHYTRLEQVPEFLREDHPDASLSQWNDEMAGKILIPQPLGALDNLYTAKSGFCISKFMVLEFATAVIVAAIFIRVAQHASSGERPRGRFWNLFEALLLFIRDGVARPAIGAHDADRFLPLLWTLFFFILGCNLMGMLPWAGSPTASLAVTGAFACVTFATVLVSGMAKFGPVGFWINQVPHMDLPLPLAIVLKPVIFVIEVGGMFIRHAILSVRLLANMAAGHVVLASIMALIASAAAATLPTWATVTTISVVGCTLLSCLELFVAVLQAYVFTFLSALFIGAAVHHH